MMRHLYKMTLTCLMAAASFPCAAHGEEIFARLAENKQVESTYVSGRFAHNMKRWNSMSGQHAINLSQGFSSLYNYQCYSSESVALAKKILKDYLSKDKGMELVMRTNNHGSEYMVYEKFNKEDKLVRMLIWSCDSPNLCEIVVVDWKEGLERDTSSLSLPYFGNPVAIEIPLVDALAGLSEVSKLRTLGDFPGFSIAEDLSRLSALSQLSEFNDPAVPGAESSEYNYTIIIEQE